MKTVFISVLLGSMLMGLTYAGECEAPLDNVIQTAFRNNGLSFAKTGAIDKRVQQDKIGKLLTSQGFLIPYELKNNQDNVTLMLDPKSGTQMYILTDLQGKVTSYFFKGNVYDGRGSEGNKEVLKFHQLNENCEIDYFGFVSENEVNVLPVNCGDEKSDQSMLKFIESCGTQDTPLFSKVIGAGKISDKELRVMNLQQKLDGIQSNLNQIQRKFDFCTDYKLFAKNPEKTILNGKAKGPAAKGL